MFGNSTIGIVNGEWEVFTVLLLDFAFMTLSQNRNAEIMTTFSQMDLLILSSVLSWMRVHVFGKWNGDYSYNIQTENQSALNRMMWKNINSTELSELSLLNPFCRIISKARYQSHEKKMRLQIQCPLIMKPAFWRKTNVIKLFWLRIDDQLMNPKSKSFWKIKVIAWIETLNENHDISPLDDLYAHAAFRIVPGLLDFNDYFYVTVSNSIKAIFVDIFLETASLIRESLVCNPPEWPEAINIVSFLHWFQ